MDQREALSILELTADASEEDIRVAYRRLAKRWHPDEISSERGKAYANGYMIRINEAHDYLMKHPVSDERRGERAADDIGTCTEAAKEEAVDTSVGSDAAGHQKSQEAGESQSDGRHRFDLEYVIERTPFGVIFVLLVVAFFRMDYLSLIASVGTNLVILASSQFSFMAVGEFDPQFVPISIPSVIWWVFLAVSIANLASGFFTDLLEACLLAAVRRRKKR